MHVKGVDWIEMTLDRGMSWGLVNTRQCTFQFHRMWGVYWVPEQPALTIQLVSQFTERRSSRQVATTPVHSAVDEHMTAFASVRLAAPTIRPTVSFSANATGANVKMFVCECRICANVKLSS